MPAAKDATAKFRERRKDETKEAANGYLQKHHLDEVLQEAVRDLLEIKPDDPITFLCEHLKRRNNNVLSRSAAEPTSDTNNGISNPSGSLVEDKQHTSERADDLQPHHLATWRTGEHGLAEERKLNQVANPMVQKWPNMNFLNPDELVAGHIIKNDSKAATRHQEIESCVRGNATKSIYWEPSTVKAALVTCGGLCPGLNSIIREVTTCLWFDYGVRDIVGCQAGFNGLSDFVAHPLVPLNPDNVREIHMKGGSILKAGRGGLDLDRICDNLATSGINMLFVIGGDGTQHAGNLVYEAAKKRDLPVSIVGVPKSIDNDVLFFDKTFGFDTAVEAASEVIRNSWAEATSHDKGVGIVKLMGRDAGFVAMHAALASTIVDLVLVPEVKFKLEDVYKHIDEVLERKNHMVIAVAEGAGQDIVATGEKDSTGHTVYGDIGIKIRDAVNKYLKEKGGRSFYIDPSYIIRSVPVRPNDHIYCARLARDAVHTGMRGYTGVCVGPVHNIISLIPSKLIARGKKHIKITASNWQSCVQSCKMPKALCGGCQG
jgi:6-phosphofructokinase 1